MAKVDLVIRGGPVFDGSGGAPIIAPGPTVLAAE